MDGQEAKNGTPGKSTATNQVKKVAGSSRARGISHLHIRRAYAQGSSRAQEAEMAERR